MKVFTHHEFIYRIPICVHNKNCEFMRTYIPCYIRSEEKVPLTQNYSKTRLNKRNTFWICYLPFNLSLFSTTVRHVLPYLIKGCPDNCPLVSVWFRVTVRIGYGAIFLEGNFPRANKRDRYLWRTFQPAAYLPLTEQSLTKRVIKVNDFSISLSFQNSCL